MPVRAGALEVAGGGFCRFGCSMFVSLAVVPSKMGSGFLASSRVTGPFFQPSQTLNAPMRQINMQSSTTKKFGPIRGIVTRIIRTPFPVRETRSGKPCISISGFLNSPQMTNNANMIVSTVCTRKSMTGMHEVCLGYVWIAQCRKTS